MLNTTTHTTVESQEVKATTDASALVFTLFGEGKVDEARSLCDDLLPETSGDARAALLITRAIIERGAGNYGLALMLLEACETSTPELQGRVHNGLAISCRLLGQPDRAIIEYSGAAEYFTQAGQPHDVARVENNIANLLVDLNRPEEALEYVARAEKVLTTPESLAEVFDTKSRALRAMCK